AEVPDARLAADLAQRLRALRIHLCLGDVVRPDEVEACAAALAACGDAVNEALLWCDAGRALYQAGDLTLAEAFLSRAAHRGGSEVRADALLQLGRLEHLRDRPASALERFDEARRQGRPAQVLEARLRRLLVLLELDRRDAARAEMDELPDIADLPED